MCFCETLFIKASNIIKPYCDAYPKFSAGKSAKTKCYDKKHGKFHPEAKNRDQKKEEMWVSKTSLSEFDITPRDLDQKQVEKHAKNPVRSNGLTEINSR